MRENLREAYRNSIRRVLVQLLEKPPSGKRSPVYKGLLRVMDDGLGYVDLNHPRNRLFLDLDVAGQLLWFIAEQPLRQTNLPEHFVWVKALYEVYLRWVGPKKFSVVGKSEFVRTLKEMFGWEVEKKKGRLAFIGLLVKE